MLYLKRDSMYTYTHIHNQSTHAFRASSYVFFPPTLSCSCLSHTAYFCISPSFQIFLLFLVSCRQRHFEGIFFCNCWPTSAYMLIFQYTLDHARVYLVIWSLRVSIQDWVAEACALTPDASKSLVRASTQYTQIYPNVHQDCSWPRQMKLIHICKWTLATTNLFFGVEPQPTHIHVCVWECLPPPFPLFSLTPPPSFLRLFNQPHYMLVLSFSFFYLSPVIFCTS